MKKKLEKGRHGKITNRISSEIVRLRSNKVKVTELAAKYGLSLSTIYNILHTAGIATERTHEIRTPVNKWRKYNCGWKFGERSTRNCLNAKVRPDSYRGKPRGEVYCNRGRRLNLRKPSISVERVIATPRFVCSVCEYCSEFGHDRSN